MEKREWKSGQAFRMMGTRKRTAKRPWIAVSGILKQEES